MNSDQKELSFDKIKESISAKIGPNSLGATTLFLNNFPNTDIKDIGLNSKEKIFKPLYNKGIEILQRLLLLEERTWSHATPNEFQLYLEESFFSGKTEYGELDKILKEAYGYRTFEDTSYLSDLIIFWYALTYIIEILIFGKYDTNFLRKEKNIAIIHVQWFLFYIHQKGLFSKDNQCDWSLNLTQRVSKRNELDLKEGIFSSLGIVLNITEYGHEFDVIDQGLLTDYPDVPPTRLMLNWLALCELWIDIYLWETEQCWKNLRSDEIEEINSRELKRLKDIAQRYTDVFNTDKSLHKSINMLPKSISKKYASEELWGIIKEFSSYIDNMYKNKAIGYPTGNMTEYISDKTQMVYNIFKTINKVGIEAGKAGKKRIVESIELVANEHQINDSIIDKIADEIINAPTLLGKDNFVVKAKIMNIFLNDRFERTVEQKLLSKMIKEYEKAPELRELNIKK